MRRLPFAVAALALPILLVGTPRAAAGTDESSLCADCHDSLVATFPSNPHAPSAGEKTCSPCHQGAVAHAEAGGDKSLVTVPKGTSGAVQCAACHAGGLDEIDPKGVHTRAGVACDSCHAIHGAVAEPLLRSAGSTGCVSCHPTVASEFAKPYTHPMHGSVDGAGSAGMQCAACHNPHGGPTRTLRRERSGDSVCVSCHTDKRGPFVYTHPASVTGSCQSCHEPHGSNNPMLLTRARVAQLCLECHTGAPAGLLGSQPPSLHDLRSPRYQNCTSCHVAVHGSNASPLLVR